MTTLRARALNTQGQPVQGRTARLLAYTGNRYDELAGRGIPAVSGADGWLSWTLPDPQHRPGPRGLYWVITGLETTPVVAATQPADGTVTLDQKRVGTLDPEGEIVPVSTGVDNEVTISDATDTAKGIVELATSAETITGTDTARAVTPAGLKAVTNGLVASASVDQIVTLTQAAYDALGVKDPATLYVVTG